MSVSLLQMARAYTIFAGNGELLPARIFKTEDEQRGRPMQVSLRSRDDATVRGVPVIKPETAAAMRKMLEMAAGPKGTAPLAQVPGYRVGGKTGTTTKIENGRYVKKYVASFVGMAPMSDPRMIVAVMIDEPSAGKYYGGQIAGPVFSQDRRRRPADPERRARRALRDDDLADGGLEEGRRVTVSSVISPVARQAADWLTAAVAGACPPVLGQPHDRRRRRVRRLPGRDQRRTRLHRARARRRRCGDRAGEGRRGGLRAPR